jgi:putative nucleotidyltransferase with HDIG domain
MKEKEKQALFDEITEHLLSDEKPSEYINRLSKEAEYQCFPLEMLWKLKETEQSKKYHPEGSVYQHTIMVVDEAAKVRDISSDAKALMWAALLHDIGKPETTRTWKGRTTSYDHDKAGERLSVEFLNCFTDDRTFIEKVSALVRYHMHMLYVLKELPYSDIRNLLRKVDIHEIALLSRCDRFGRAGADTESEEAQYQEYLNRLMRLSEKDYQKQMAGIK